MKLIRDSKLEGIRVDSGITVAELSKESNLSTRTINRIEAGDNVKVEMLKQAYISLNSLRETKGLSTVELTIV